MRRALCQIVPLPRPAMRYSLVAASFAVLACSSAHRDAGGAAAPAAGRAADPPPPEAAAGRIDDAAVTGCASDADCSLDVAGNRRVCVADGPGCDAPTRCEDRGCSELGAAVCRCDGVVETQSYCDRPRAYSFPNVMNWDIRFVTCDPSAPVDSAEPRTLVVRASGLSELPDGRLIVRAGEHARAVQAVAEVAAGRFEVTLGDALSVGSMLDAQSQVLLATVDADADGRCGPADPIVGLSARLASEERPLSVNQRSIEVTLGPEDVIADAAAFAALDCAVFER